MVIKMNKVKTRSRMFQSVGYTWNPCVGCNHDCPWCWARRFAKKRGQTFAPHISRKTLNTDFPKDGKWIFVTSMGDLFCSGMNTGYIKEVLTKIRLQGEGNIFLLMTQNPERFFNPDLWPILLGLQDRIVLGTTLQTNRLMNTNAPQPVERYQAIVMAKELGFKTFLSLEPLADYDPLILHTWIGEMAPEAVEIGLENYTNILSKPSDEKIRILIDFLENMKIDYKLKSNLERLAYKL